MKSDLQILEDLKVRTKGLIWISESDYPFEVLTVPKIRLKDAINISDLSDLFSKVTKLNREMSRGERSIARKFQKLEKYMNKHLKNVKVYKFENKRSPALFDLYILGRSLISNNLIGIKTSVVET